MHMQTITVDKKDLIDKLNDNRKEHRETFEKAWAGYRQAMIETLQNNLDSLKENPDGKVEVHVNLVRPVDHTEDYDRAIQMLLWEQAEEIELTTQEFTTLVQDDWGWKREFASTNAAYINK